VLRYVIRTVEGFCAAFISASIELIRLVTQFVPSSVFGSSEKPSRNQEIRMHAPFSPSWLCSHDVLDEKVLEREEEPEDWGLRTLETSHS
jgi:hypothetical protein